MNTYNKYIRSILPLFVVLGLVGSLQAQQETASATASADIVSALSITKTADISFGNVSATTDGVVSLDPVNESHAYVGASADLGLFTISGANNTQINFTYDAEVTLTDGSSNNLYLITALAGSLDNSSYSSIGTAGSGDFTITSGGTYYLRVGGQLSSTSGSATALNGQTTGTYQGIFNTAVVYN